MSKIIYFKFKYLRNIYIPTQKIQKKKKMYVTVIKPIQNHNTKLLILFLLKSVVYIIILCTLVSYK